MKIASVQLYHNKFQQRQNHTEANSPSFRAYSYNPGAKIGINRLNPVTTYVSKVFERTLAVSRIRIKEEIPEIKPYTREVLIGKSYAWDINKDNRKKYLMVLHGVGQNISNLQTLYKEVLEKTPYAILAPEYQGFGKNKPAKISSKTLLKDTQAALDYLTHEKDIRPEDISVVGHSLGGFIAAQLVRKNNDLNRLIMVCPLESFRQNSVNIETTFDNNMPKWLGYVLKNMEFLRMPLNRVIKTNYFVKKINVPVDIIHAKDDKVINYISSEKLASHCKNLSSLNIAENGGHRLDLSKINMITSILSRN